MSRIARYGKMVAQAGRGPELADVLLAAAADLQDVDGCQLYLVNHQTGDPDTIWVTELWRSEADLAATISKIAGSERVAAARALVVGGEVIELELIGGKG